MSSTGDRGEKRGSPNLPAGDDDVHRAKRPRSAEAAAAHDKAASEAAATAHTKATAAHTKAAAADTKSAADTKAADTKAADTKAPAAGSAAAGSVATGPVAVVPDHLFVVHSVAAGTLGSAGNADGIGKKGNRGGGNLINSPAGLVNSRGLFFCDAGNNCVRVLNSSDGAVRRVAGDGSGVGGYGEGALEEAWSYPPEGVQVDSLVGPLFFEPRGLCLDASDESQNRMVVADTGNHVIRLIDADPDRLKTSIIAGVPKTKGFTDGPSNAAMFNNPRGVSTDAEGNIYVADTGNNRIRCIEKKTMIVRTFAGAGHPGCSDGAAQRASFNAPQCVSVDAKTRRIFIGQDGALRVITPPTMRNGFSVDTLWVDSSYVMTGLDVVYSHPGGTHPHDGLIVLACVRSKVHLGLNRILRIDLSRGIPSVSPLVIHDSSGADVTRDVIKSPSALLFSRFTGSVYVSDKAAHVVHRFTPRDRQSLFGVPAPPIAIGAPAVEAPAAVAAMAAPAAAAPPSAAAPAAAAPPSAAALSAAALPAAAPGAAPLPPAAAFAAAMS